MFAMCNGLSHSCDEVIVSSEPTRCHALGNGSCQQWQLLYVLLMIEQSNIVEYLCSLIVEDVTNIDSSSWALMVCVLNNVT